MRILPFLDLALWQMMEGLTLPHHRVASALYPDEFDVDLTERVRKVTRPLAEQLIDHDFLEDDLRPLAEAQRAGGTSR